MEVPSQHSGLFSIQRSNARSLSIQQFFKSQWNLVHLIAIPNLQIQKTSLVELYFFFEWTWLDAESEIFGNSSWHFIPTISIRSQKKPKWIILCLNILQSELRASCVQTLLTEHRILHPISNFRRLYFTSNGFNMLVKLHKLSHDLVVNQKNRIRFIFCFKLALHVLYILNYGTGTITCYTLDGTIASGLLKLKSPGTHYSYQTKLRIYSTDILIGILGAYVYSQHITYKLHCFC